MLEKEQQELLSEITNIKSSWFVEKDSYIPDNVLDVYNEEYISTDDLVKHSKNIIARYIKMIIIRLLSENNYVYEDVSPNNNEVDYLNRFYIVISENKDETVKDCLYIFKEFGINNRIDEDKIKIMIKNKEIGKFSYISYVYRDSWKEILSYDIDLQDDSKGTNAYSLIYFLKKYFKEEQVRSTLKLINDFKCKIKQQIDFSIIKKLNRNSLQDFKHEIAEELANYSYNLEVYDKNHNKLCLDISESENIRSQFIGLEYYKTLIGEHNFSKSFITSEWLYRALKNSVNIDCTPIVLGYLKSVEQFLFSFIQLHTSNKDNCKRKIDFGNKKVDLTDELASSIDFYDHITLHPLLKFINKNTDLLNNNTENLHKYIESLSYKFKHDRNNYLHKDNINDSEFVSIVESIRNDTFMMFYVLLGGYRISIDQIHNVFLAEQETEIDKLYNYLNYDVQKDYRLISRQISNDNPNFIILPLFFLIKDNVTYGPYQVSKDQADRKENRMFIFKKTKFRDPKCRCEKDLVIKYDAFDYVVVQTWIQIDRFNREKIIASKDNKIIFNGNKFINT